MFYIVESIRPRSAGMPHPTPPASSDAPSRLATALLRALLPRAERAEVLEDLAGEFASRRAAGPIAARWWYWQQVLASVPALLRRSWWRGWRGFEPRANAMRPGGPALEQWITDCRYAARRLLRRPLYSALAVVTLAVGIGGVAAVWGIARAVLFDPLPYAHEESLVDFWDHFGWTQEEFAWVRTSPQSAAWRNMRMAIRR